MDLAWIIAAIVAVLGGGGVLFYRQRKEQLMANIGKTEAESGLLGVQAENTETGMLVSIIGVLRSEMDRQALRLGALEKRVTALERENRELRRSVDNLLNLVRRMWGVIRENNLDVDPDLVEAVCEAIEDSA